MKSEMKSLGWEFSFLEKPVASASKWFENPVAFFKEATFREHISTYVTGDFSHSPGAWVFELKARPQTRFAVISAHLKPGSGIVPRETRHKEVENILTFLPTLQVDEKCVMIIGDMNLGNGPDFQSVHAALQAKRFRMLAHINDFTSLTEFPFDSPIKPAVPIWRCSGSCLRCINKPIESTKKMHK